jgi:hypothetical protein
MSHSNPAERLRPSQLKIRILLVSPIRPSHLSLLLLLQAPRVGLASGRLFVARLFKMRTVINCSILPMSVSGMFSPVFSRILIDVLSRLLLFAIYDVFLHQLLSFCIMTPIHPGLLAITALLFRSP